MSDKPESPLNDKVLSNPLNPFSETVGRTTEVFGYRTEIDGVSVFVIESVELDLNGNTGSTKSISLTGNDRFKGSIDSLSKEDKELVSGALTNNSDRDEAYKNRMQKIRKQSEKDGKLEQFDKALEANGNLQAIIGTDSFSKNGPKTNKMRNDERIEQEQIIDAIKLKEYKESTQVQNEALYYPTNHQSDKGEDYIFIEQFEYEPPQPEGLEGLSPSDAVIDGLPRGENIKRDPTTIDKQNPNGKQIPRGSCKLPIPNKLGVSNGVSWGEAKANAVEMAAFSSTAGQIGNVIAGESNLAQLLSRGFKGTANVLKEIQKDFKESTGSGTSASDIISATLARGVLGSIGINVDVDQFITRQTGAAINPNLELLFGGPQLRTFSFNFNFAPESTTEARMVRKIQRWFKQGMLPTRSNNRKSTLFLGSPNVFRIMYRNHGRRIKGLNLIKICALTACQIDFTPDGTYQSYDDSDSVSMPVRTTMGLTFNELTPIFRDDYITDNQDPDPSLIDLGHMIEGANAIDENDIGF
tara:strand:- start:862 stop:2439 length:1578 start_codon:yes stop_codon:yes gene_type:complete